MRFITHHRYKDLALCGECLNIAYGTELKTDGETLVTSDGKAVCYRTSENAQKHFACNDDGKGILRGALTYAIAYGNRQRKSVTGGAIYRFSDEEREMLWRYWRHFLRIDVDVIIFNEEFFVADPAELQELADLLNIKIRRR